MSQSPAQPATKRSKPAPVVPTVVKECRDGVEGIWIPVNDLKRLLHNDQYERLLKQSNSIVSKAKEDSQCPHESNKIYEDSQTFLYPFDEHEIMSVIESVGDDDIRKLLVAEQVIGKAGMESWTEFYNMVRYPDNFKTTNDNDALAVVSIFRNKENYVLQKFMEQVLNLWENSCNVYDRDSFTASQLDAISEPLRTKSWKETG